MFILSIRSKRSKDWQPTETDLLWIDLSPTKDGNVVNSIPSCNNTEWRFSLHKWMELRKLNFLDTGICRVSDHKTGFRVVQWHRGTLLVCSYCNCPRTADNALKRIRVWWLWCNYSLHWRLFLTLNQVVFNHTRSTPCTCSWPLSSYLREQEQYRSITISELSKNTYYSALT